MQREVKVLAIMPQGDERARLRNSAEGQGWDVRFCGTLPDAIDLLKAEPIFTAILLDRDLPGEAWEGSVRDLAALAGVARIMLASESAAAGLWERVVEQGGHELLAKPLGADQVRRAVLHAMWYSATLGHADHS